MPQNRKNNTRTGFATGRVYKGKDKKKQALEAAAKELLGKDTSEVPKPADKPKISRAKRATAKKAQARKEKAFLKKLSDQAYVESGQKRFSKQSIKWFTNLIKDYKQADAQQNIRDKIIDEGVTPKSFTRAGYLHFMEYDAKHKDTLPYWDRFPLYFVIGPAKGGFLGINMHYMPLPMRIYVFKQLLTVANNQSYNDRMKIKLSWQVLLSVVNKNIAEFIIKHYLLTHIKSKIVRIKASDWEAALFLPVQSFQKASTAKVWRDAQKAFYK